MRIATTALIAGLALGSGTARSATFVVNSTADVVGPCTAANCTLRSAIRTANVFPGADTITLPAGTYTLTIPGKGEDATNTGDLDITESLTINGAGPATTVIDANSVDRVVDVSAASGSPAVTITGVTLKRGCPTIFTQAAGGVVRGTVGSLTLSGVTVTGGCQSTGGGIAVVNGAALTLVRSTVSDSLGVGGGIYLEAGNHTIQDSTISANSAGFGLSSGGGILLEHATLNIVNSTVTGNFAGAIAFANSTLTMRNVTVTENDRGLVFADGVGGASVVSLSNVIVSGNGGFADCHTIAGLGEPFSPVASLGHNLIGNFTPTNGSPGCTLAPADPTDLSGAPDLGPLQDNEGPTATHLPNPASLAIDHGSTTTSGPAACATTDQRGAGRPRGARCDIGAVERTICGDGIQDAVVEQCDHGAQNGLDGCCASSCQLLATDADGDGWCTGVTTPDNCPADPNPDQSNLDADAPAVGDLCDPCPGCAGTACCKAARTTKALLGAAAATLQTTDAAVKLDIPAGTFTGPRSVSITGVDQSSYGLGGVSGTYPVVARFGPAGALGQKVTVTYKWPDQDADGKADIDLNNNGVLDPGEPEVDETNLKLFHNGKRVGACVSDQLIACECAGNPPCPSSSDCVGLASAQCGQTDCSATAGNPNCNRATNRWVFKVDDFSEYALGSDPCGPIAEAKLGLKKIAPPAGDDSIVMKGIFTLPPGLTFSAVRPDAHGLRVGLADEAAAVASALLAAGPYDGVSGWKLNGAGTKATYTNKSLAPPAGITKAALQDRARKAPGRVAVTFKGKKGSFAAGTAVAAAVTLPDAELCYHATFPGPGPKQSCVVTGGGSGLKCQWFGTTTTSTSTTTTTLLQVLCCAGVVGGLPVCFDSEASQAATRCAAEGGTLAPAGQLCDGAGSGTCAGTKTYFGCCDTPDGRCFESGSFLLTPVCDGEGGTISTSATCDPATHQCSMP